MIANEAVKLNKEIKRLDKYGIEASRIEAIGHGVGDIFSVPAWNRVGICTIDEVK